MKHECVNSWNIIKLVISTKYIIERDNIWMDDGSWWNYEYKYIVLMNEFECVMECLNINDGCGYSLIVNY